MELEQRKFTAAQIDDAMAHLVNTESPTDGAEEHVGALLESSTFDSVVRGVINCFDRDITDGDTPFQATVTMIAHIFMLGMRVGAAVVEKEG